jgi:hypothetical protein
MRAATTYQDGVRALFRTEAVADVRRLNRPPLRCAVVESQGRRLKLGEAARAARYGCAVPRRALPRPPAGAGRRGRLSRPHVRGAVVFARPVLDPLGVDAGRCRPDLPAPHADRAELPRLQDPSRRARPPAQGPRGRTPRPALARLLSGVCPARAPRRDARPGAGPDETSRCSGAPRGTAPAARSASSPSR